MEGAGEAVGFVAGCEVSALELTGCVALGNPDTEAPATPSLTTGSGFGKRNLASSFAVMLLPFPDMTTTPEL